MNFDYTIQFLNAGVHGHPEDKKKEIEKVIEILTKSNGYLTKNKPIRVVFHKELDTTKAG